MAGRGRPPYPDILTPREWEVLALLRDGLTNGQIAARLGITERTAKFHVSEILSKLGVDSREEAAVWNQVERRRWWTAAMHWPLKLSIAAKIAAASLIAGTAAGIALLVWGVVATDAPPFDGPPDVIVEREGDVAILEPRVDGLCEVLTFDDNGEFVDWRVDQCEELEGGGRSCYLDEQLDANGNLEGSGSSCGTPTEGRVKMRCTEAGCEEWSVGLFGDE